MLIDRMPLVRVGGGDTNTGGSSSGGVGAMRYAPYIVGGGGDSASYAMGTATMTSYSSPSLTGNDLASVGAVAVTTTMTTTMKTGTLPPTTVVRPAVVRPARVTRYDVGAGVEPANRRTDEEIHNELLVEHGLKYLPETAFRDLEGLD